MKKNILLVISLIYVLSAISQNVDDTESLYIVAIEKDIELYDKYIEEGIGIIKPKKIVIQYNDFIKNYPKEIKGLKLFELTRQNSKKLFRKNGNSLPFIKLEPIIIQNEFLIITITKINAILENNNYILPHGDWTDIYFKFNCEVNMWEYFKTEIRGI